MAKAPTGTVSIDIHNVGALGIIRDIPGHQLPSEAWTDGNNVRFQDKNAVKFKGHSAAFGTPSVAPAFLLNFTSAGQSYWFYTSLTKAYVYEGGVHTNVTRQTAAVDVNYATVNYRDWNGGVFGGIPILNNGTDIPQYWPAVSLGTKLANLVNWPSGMRAKVVKPFGRYLLALNINDGGTLRPHMFWWSHKADPGSVPSSWDYTDATVDAGRKELTDIEGGDIVDGLMLGNFFVLYKETSTHVISYIGGQEIMGNDLILPNSGLLAPRCMTPYANGKGHFVATADTFLVHSGQRNSAETILDGKVRKTVFAEIDLINFRNSLCFTNHLESEVWFCYPTSGQTHPNKALIWNWRYNTTQFRDFSGYAAAAGFITDFSSDTWADGSDTWDSDVEQWSRQDRRRVIVGDPINTKFWKLDDTETFNAVDMSTFLEREGLAMIGRDRHGDIKVDFQRRKLVKRVWPKVKGTSRITVRLGAQETRESPVTWQGSAIFDPTTQEYVDLTAQGRLIAIRFESISHDAWQLEGYDLDVALLGEH